MEPGRAALTVEATTVETAVLAFLYRNWEFRLAFLSVVLTTCTSVWSAGFTLPALSLSAGFASQVTTVFVTSTLPYWLVTSHLLHCVGHIVQTMVLAWGVQQRSQVPVSLSLTVFVLVTTLRVYAYKLCKWRAAQPNVWRQLSVPEEERTKLRVLML